MLDRPVEWVFRGTIGAVVPVAGGRIIAVTDHFLLVGRLVPEDQEVVSVPIGTTVSDALELMRKRRFDQIPVLAGSRVVGVFSYRSLATHVARLRPQDDVMRVRVDDVLEDLAFVRPTTEVGDILQHIDEKGAVLVGEAERVLAVATASDVSAYLWQTSRPFILLQDIELGVRHLMRLACPEPAVMAQAIRGILPDAGLGDRALPTTLEGLTYGQLLAVLRRPKALGNRFKEIFGRLDLAISWLEPVGNVRNKVFHFRDEVTLEELEVLVVARTWLQRKIGQLQ